MICIVAILAVLWYGELPIGIFAIIVAVIVVFGLIAMFGTGYRADRWSFLNPWDDGQGGYGSGYNIMHSYFAFSEGGIFGVGLASAADAMAAVRKVIFDDGSASPEALLKLCSDLLAEREKNAALREENAMLEGKAAFYDLFIDLKHSTNLRTTAKELVVPERRFVRFLLEQRFVYRAPSGNVLPYAKPANDGLFTVKDYCNHGHTGSYTLVTPQGKLFFAQLRDSILLMI